MLAYTYIEKGCFELLDKPKPKLQSEYDAIVKVTLSSICTSDLHIKHGSVPRAVPGITVGHEMVQDLFIWYMRISGTVYPDSRQLFAATDMEYPMRKHSRETSSATTDMWRFTWAAARLYTQVMRNLELKSATMQHTDPFLL